jgi:hypothetical protein
MVGDYDWLNMRLGWGDKHIENFGLETSWKT